MEDKIFCVHSLLHVYIARRIDLKILSVILISAELVIEEKIDYNDLVATVEDGKTSSLDDGNKSIVGRNKEEPKAGNFLENFSGSFCPN